MLKFEHDTLLVESLVIKIKSRMRNVYYALNFILANHMKRPMT